MGAVFITATGTDVGKTFVACGLIRALRRSGRAVDALKPIVSGYDPARAQDSDPGRLLAALGRPVTDAEVARLSPWRFAAPLSPDLAARREDRTINVAAVSEFCRRAIAAGGGTLLIEGVGGVMVPLDARHTVLDWMADLSLPVIVVAGSYLGTISHTLSALDVIERRGLKVLALVVSKTAGATVTLEDTVASLGQFTGPAEIVPLPRLAAGSHDHPAFARLAQRL